MNILRKNLVVTLAALGMASAALGVQAQARPPAAEGRHGHAVTVEQCQARMAERRTEHQTRLHDALKLTPAQEPAWKSFIASSALAKAGACVERGAMANLPAPQRLEKRIALQKERTANMEAHLAALNSFYAVLTPEQKKVFDEQSRHGHHRGHGKHGKMHG